MNDLMARLTSRKFLLALASGAFGVLAGAGVIPADAMARDTAIAAPLLFIAVEGAADLIERGKLSPATVKDAEAAALSTAAAVMAPNELATSPAKPSA